VPASKMPAHFCVGESKEFSLFATANGKPPAYVIVDSPSARTVLAG
jgi:hypothetical protein